MRTPNVSPTTHNVPSVPEDLPMHSVRAEHEVPVAPPLCSLAAAELATNAAMEEAQPPANSQPHNPNLEARAAYFSRDPLVHRIAASVAQRWGHPEPEELEADTVWRLTTSGLTPGAPGAVGFILRTAINLCIDRHRSASAGSRPPTTPIEPGRITVPDRAPPAERAITNRIMLKSLLDTLSASHREIIFAVYFEGLSFLEAAKALDIPLGSVKSRMHYAMKYLRQAAEERDYSPQDLV